MLLIPFKFLVEILSTQIHLDRFFFFLMYFKFNYHFGSLHCQSYFEIFFLFLLSGRLDYMVFIFLIYKMKQQNLEKPI